ncbi:MAG: hypothetical protein NT111_03215 [Patescibacteria group bacterium]|nr:hypothetical protein [Patescibacteria group bacterium]
MYIVKKFLQIFSVLLLSFISVVLIGMVNPQIARADETCEWGPNAAGSMIVCGGGDEAEHRMQINNTGADGYFYVNSNGTGILLVKADIKENAAGEVVNFRYKQCTSGVLSSCKDRDIKLTVENPQRFDETNTSELCGPQNKLGDKCKDAWGVKITIDQAQSDKLASAKASFKVDTAGICEASGVALSFITCPIYEGTSNAIAGLIGPDGFLNGFLTVNVNQGNAEQNPLQDIVQQIIGLANAIYVLIFILLIFSASLPLGLDNYSIKKMLPKFVGAVIMTQFAYPITIGVVEFFNLLGNVVPNVIFSFIPLVDKTAEAPGVAGSAALAIGLGAALALGPGQAILAGIFIIIILLAIVALIAVIITFVFLTIRLIIIYILILLAPLA